MIGVQKYCLYIDPLPNPRKAVREHMRISPNYDTYYYYYANGYATIYLVFHISLTGDAFITRSRIRLTRDEMSLNGSVWSNGRLQIRDWEIQVPVQIVSNCTILNLTRLSFSSKYSHNVAEIFAKLRTAGVCCGERRRYYPFRDLTRSPPHHAGLSFRLSIISLNTLP
uniref:L-type lectin-like domain-containing protein n=1 Tax=Angiostrongylus cantonensis TaxID=6313 RepID=A0A0K0DIY8_ANGCA